jgi:DNA topoisomerase I
LTAGSTRKSKAIIPKNLDKAMDKANPSPKNAAPGISIRNGPMVEMEIDGPVVNGAETNGNAGSKRKARNSIGQKKSYKEMSDEDDEKPLVN